MVLLAAVEASSKLEEAIRSLVEHGSQLGFTIIKALIVFLVGRLVIKYNMAYRRFRHVGEDKVTMDFAFFAIAFNIKKMCAKLIKERKGLITVGKYMFMGLFITRYNWNIATCCQMHEEKAA